MEQGYTYQRKSNAERKWIDPLILIKMVLQQLFNLSDEELELQVNLRRTFEEFIGLARHGRLSGHVTAGEGGRRLRLERSRGQEDGILSMKPPEAHR